MKQTVNFTMFCDAFARRGRGNNFSFEGQQALFNHLTKLEAETGTEIELDPICLCIDYSENSYKDFGVILQGDEDSDIERVREFLESRSQFVAETIPGHFIFQEF